MVNGIYTFLRWVQVLNTNAEEICEVQLKSFVFLVPKIKSMWIWSEIKTVKRTYVFEFEITQKPSDFTLDKTFPLLMQIVCFGQYLDLNKMLISFKEGKLLE